MIEGLTGIASLEAEMRDRLADKNREIESLRAQLASARKALEPFARAAEFIPDTLPDDLWTHCSSYSWEMSDEEFDHLKASGIPLKDKKAKLSLWVDGHPLSEFRRARAALKDLP